MTFPPQRRRGDAVSPLGVQERASLLAAARLFEGLSAEGLEALAGRCGDRVLGDDETLYHSGEPADAVYVVVEGVVEVTGPTEEAARFGPGDVIGETAALAEAVHETSAEARGNARVLFLKTKALRLAIQQRPDIAFAVFQSLAERLQAADDLVGAWAQPGEDDSGPSLVVTRGADAGRRFPIVLDETLIGRRTHCIVEDARRCALSEPAERVAIRHLQVIRTRDGFYVRELPPMGAARLQGEPIIGAMELSDGDEIHLGETTLVFSLGREE